MWTFKSAGSLVTNTKGNAAMIFALCLIPLFIVIGAVLDMNRQKSAQYKIQHALDFAVVSTARFALTNDATDAELKKVAQTFFDGELEKLGEVSLNKLSFTRNGEEVVLSVAGDMPTSIMQIAGQTKMPLGTEAAAVFGEPSSAEIALVLDTSYSMTGSRMSTLKTAAEDMITTLVKDDSSAVKMSIVPFATYVNVGTDKKGQSWLNVQADKSTTSKNCWIPGSWYKTNCKRESYSCTRDGVKKTCKRWVCDPDDLNTAPKKCKTQTKTQTWYGCVNSRKDPYNIKDGFYSTQKVTGFRTNNASTCPTPIQALTNKADDLKSKVSALKANQNTYIATGLTWGLRTLSPDAPFDEAASYADFKAINGRKALVLMSDGANTKSPKANGYHNGNNKTLANENTEKVCDEIKAADIELYTIAFEIDDSDTKKLLRDCATDPDFYYDAKDSADLKEAFAKISDEFRDIALAR
jgi:Flp pilus assembly protein TadG